MSQEVPEAKAPEKPEPGEVMAVAQRVRFCGKCGRPLEGDACAHCAERAVRVAEAEQTYTVQMREIKSALRLYFALLAVSLVLVIAAIGSRRAPGLGAELTGTIGMSVVIAVWSARRRDLVCNVLGRAPTGRWLGISVVCPIVTVIVASGSIALLHRTVDLGRIEYLAPFRQAGAGFGWAVLVICVQPAVFEELAFRGVIQGALETVVMPWQAIIVSAMMFAILHLSIPSMPHLIVLGLALAWMRRGSGSIYPGMIAHFLHNLIVLTDEWSGGRLLWW